MKIWIRNFPFNWNGTKSKKWMYYLMWINNDFLVQASRFSSHSCDTLCVFSPPGLPVSLPTLCISSPCISKANFHRTTWSPITELLSAHQCSLVKASSHVYKLDGLQVFDSGSVCAVVVPMQTPWHIFLVLLNAYLLCIELCFIGPIIFCLQKNAILTMLLLTMFLFKCDIQFTSFAKILQTFLSLNSTIHATSNSISLQFQCFVSKFFISVEMQRSEFC